MKTIKLAEVRIDGGTQSRVSINQLVVQNYAECMNNGDKFPPLFTVYDGTTHWLVDGFHRYFALCQLGFTSVDVEYKPGTLEEAQILSYGQNSTHGLHRTNEDKKKAVEAAIAHPMLISKTNYEIAKICAVSQPFVASIRNPESKEKQQKSKEKHIVKKSKEINDLEDDVNVMDEPNTNQISIDGAIPSAAELEDAEKAFQADLEAMNMILDSDERLKDAHDEIKRLNLRVVQLERVNKGLQNERNEAVSQVKRLQAIIDKMKKDK
jgi:hypothetical protein